MGLIRLNQGLCTSRAPAELRNGQLQVATGVRYKPGDTERAHKVSGRSAFGTVTASTNVKGLALCQFDTPGSDLLLAYAGTIIRKATPGDTGTFSDLVTGLDASATRLSAAHAYDKWFLCNGYDRNRVLKSDGTVRFMSMQPPDTKCVAVASFVTKTTPTRPNADAATSGAGFTEPTKAYDVPGNKITDTFARATLAAPGALGSRFTFASAGANTWNLKVTWSLGSLVQFINFGGDEVGTGGVTSMGGVVDVRIEYATDWNGSTGTFADLARYDNQERRIGVTTSSVQTANINPNLIAVRATLTYDSGRTDITMRIYDIRLETASVDAFTTTTGMFYTFTEWDGVNLLESGPAEVSELVTMTSQNIVTVTLPGAGGARNTTTTHYRIYRTHDGGVTPVDLGRIDEVPVSQTTYVDTFILYDKDTPAPVLLPLVSITADDGRTAIRVPRDGAAPSFAHLNYYKGSLVGISRTQPRALYYSFAGRVESWPELYVIESFPMREHDTLVATVTCGDSLIIAGRDIMMTMDDLPRVVQGVFSAVEVRPLRGQPGVVNQDAITTFSVAGEPRCAWVSYFGIHETNGTVSRRISLNIDWDATVGLGTSHVASAQLSWDAQMQCLVLAIDSDQNGLNDRYYLIHMAPEHAGEDNQPKWTGPHYGRISSQAAGIVSNVYKRYTGHPTDGVVYLEGGTTDASQSYSSTQVPLIVTTPRLYGEEFEWGVFKGNIRHTSFGAQNLAVQWVSRRDARDSSQTVNKTVSLNNAKGTEFYVGLAGESHEVTLTHTDAASGALHDIRFEPMRGYRPGRVA